MSAGKEGYQTERFNGGKGVHRPLCTSACFKEGEIEKGPSILEEVFGNGYRQTAKPLEKVAGRPPFSLKEKKTEELSELRVSKDVIRKKKKKEVPRSRIR